MAVRICPGPCQNVDSPGSMPGNSYFISNLKVRPHGESVYAVVKHIVVSQLVVEFDPVFSGCLVQIQEIVFLVPVTAIVIVCEFECVVLVLSYM